MVHLVDGTSELYLDDALDPILIVTWIGPATLELAAQLARWTAAQNEIAKRLDRPVIVVHDALAADRPSADVRRAFAEQARDSTVKSRTFVVLTNPLVRGAMTAIGWLAGDSFDVVACKTLDEAFAQAAEYARANGLVPPSATMLARHAARSAARSA